MSAPSSSVQESSQTLSKDKAELLRVLSEQKSKRGQKIEPYPRKTGRIRYRALASWAQQRLWFIDQLEGGGTYNIAMAVRLRGMLDEKALRNALNAVMLRHEILRTTFVSQGGELFQEIAHDQQFPLDTIDLSDIKEREYREAQLRSQRIQAVSESFDLQFGPLIRARLLKLGAEENVLLVTMHHIISDGWSMGVFSRELETQYRSYRHGSEHSFDHLPIQYSDYARWQREWLQGSVLDTQLNYWREQLSGAAQQLDLPTDRPRPATQDYRGENVVLTLSAELTRKVRVFAQRYDMTLFMLLYAALAILLSRLSGQQDISIGVPIANRCRPEVEGLIGLFVNTLVLRTAVPNELLVTELLRQVRELTLQAYDHQDVPFEKVVEAVQPQRSLSRSPLFQVMLSLQTGPGHQLQLPGLTVMEEGEIDEPARFDMSISLHERSDSVCGTVNYAAELFDRDTITRWIESYSFLLEEITHNYGARVGYLSILPSNQRRLVTEVFNDTASHYQREKLIYELVEQQAEQMPAKAAVIYDDKVLTYLDLNRRANQVARHLKSQGVGPNSVVAICLDRGIEMVIGLLGILKSGGAYVPLDPSYPTERLLYMLADAAPKVLLTQESLKGLLPQAQATVLLDGDRHSIAKCSDENLERHVVGTLPSHLAYVIYTSGSTGEPKGVMVSHGNLMASNSARGRFYGGPGRFLLLSPVGFDSSVAGIFGTLAHGGTLLVASQEAVRDPDALIRTIEKLEATCLLCVPSLYQRLLALPVDGVRNSKLSRVIVAGEACPPALVSEGVRRAPETTIFNEYGPTEGTVWASVFECRESAYVSSVPIGRPVSNTRIYILDWHLQPAPVGVVGEIYIGGPGVAQGYLNQPGITAERFIADPFAKGSGQRLYKTGDLGRWRWDGNIEYIGRNDLQVKIRGYRIELGEIEAQLLRQEGIREAAVIVREDRPGEKRLVAYMTTRKEVCPIAEEIRGRLKSVLPDYMVPSALVILNCFPQTPNGKLDRNALPAPEADAYAARTYEPPLGKVEETLARIWQELLGLERVGRQDNFFELGGHSLLIVQLKECLRLVGLSVSVRSVYESATLAALARTLVAESGGSIDLAVTPIPLYCDAVTPEMVPLVRLTREEIDRIVQSVPGGARNVQDIYPLAPLQEGILFHHVLDQGVGDTYVSLIVLTVLSRDRLEELLSALQGVVDRNDILRTAVLWDKLPQPIQVVYRSATLPVEELALAPNYGVQVQFGEWMKPERQRMDLRRAPLMRVQVAQDPHNGHWYAMLKLHHITCDHVTYEFVIEEVVAYLQGRADQLPEPVAYRDHVAQALEFSRAHDCEAFFREKLADVTEPTAPFGLLNVHGAGARIAEARENLAASLSRSVRSQARHLNVSPGTLIHAAWGVVVAATSGREDVVFGSVLLGRLQGTAGAKRILGMFINTLPLRLKLQGATTKDLVLQAHQELTDLLSYEQASLVTAQRSSGLAQSTSLFSALLNYRHSAAKSKSECLGAVGIEVVAFQDRTNYPLTMSVDDLGDGFALNAQTDHRIDPQRVIGYFKTALQSLVEALEQAPETPALALSVLPVSERQQLIQSFNATQAQYPKGMLIHEMFEEQVERTPTHVAAQWKGKHLTYDQLNLRANQVACHLVNKGLRPDQLVGICLERGLDMLVGLLGILKAGGAYVPLDPSYPSERLAYMVSDATPSFVLTQEGLKARLPELVAQVVLLDGDWHEIAQHPSTNLDPHALGLHSDNLAYVIYTSGSTGHPKGVAIEHRNTVNLISWARYALPQEVFARTLHATSLNFDLSVYECLVPLTTGGAIHIIEDALGLVKEKDSVDVTLINTVPSAMSALLDSHGVPKSTRVVNLAGEPLKRELVDRIFCTTSVERVCNLYGPSETTTYSTWISMSRDVGFDSSIGRPVANTQVYILNRQRQVVPIGVTGEIYIGGMGVARGYLNRPDLTQERFIPDPFASDPRERLYMTGDLGRWRPDGTIEYLGRSDRQLKIRGYRIELGEIEAQLTRHEHVKEAVVVAREDLPGDKRIVAYVVGDRGATTPTSLAPPVTETLRGEILSGWETLWKETYDTPHRAAGPSFVGWNSSYTGQPIPETEMQEWVDSIVYRIRAMRPQKILEIGCGVGLVLQHLAPQCALYVGTDISASALDQLRQWMSPRDELRHVQLLHRSALELQHLPAGSFDTVILNSVVQYFPDVEYLLSVIKEAVRLLSPDGRIFIGDVRHLGLLPMFHSAVQLSKAAASVSLGQLKKRVARAVGQEKELVLDPQFFRALPGRVPGISAVEVQLKRGRAHNELTRYRYDVVLRVGERVGTTPVCESVDWQTSVGTTVELQVALRERRWTAVRLTSIPDVRLAREAAAQTWIETGDEGLEASALRRQLNELQSDGVDPETFWSWGEANGYDVQVSWDLESRPGFFEARLLDRGRADQIHQEVLAQLDAEKPWSAYANDPLENGFRQQLIPELREYLKEHLPEYMIPSAWMLLTQLPLTPNGKLDRRALPAPQSRPEEMGEYVAPRTELQRALAEIWAQVLRVDQVGIHDNFFELGGHSLLATRVVSHISHILDVDVPLRSVFERPTVEALSYSIATEIAEEVCMEAR
jgi:amino acid adenylation domain-containing protein